MAREPQDQNNRLLEWEYERKAPDTDGYVLFGEHIRIPGLQTQYASQYIEGAQSKPALGEGLRFKDDSCGGWHGIRIHQDDVPVFLERLKKHLL